MARTDFRSVGDYIASFPDWETREGLEAMRGAIRGAVPEVEEVISYQVPAFRHHGWVAYISAHSRHYSLSCPPPSAVFESFAERLRPYAVSKSAIRFPKAEPLPLALIADIARFRAEENRARAAERPAPGRRRP